ncbi:MAG: hypothetical protein A3G71_07035 [Gammaproteobacteria bacterium RIFCSPLOWO2_12_FULL_38_14]|nr:MAG: hypothetical protein A3B69_00375 [Gammaproteobacteria bacterium RIFCSPHIGHO2_02_FULL_38_33]OGT24758.1 MAG: hypothetical protein A2W47_06790 [Gammaproteobacteria bacterium RIFCSPHIGHO2_12_38_15]OGT77153.1 MAG: hypothetical protein A3G71_07035 [Gammaproteobacteria bacterium RIFCSPLOWO2_12_FULL_38_14]
MSLKRIFYFLKFYFMELCIFIFLCFIGIIGANYYFEYHPVPLMKEKNKNSEHGIKKQNVKNPRISEDIDFIFYTLLAEEDSDLIEVVG